MTCIFVKTYFLSFFQRFFKKWFVRIWNYLRIFQHFRKHPENSQSKNLFSWKILFLSETSKTQLFNGTSIIKNGCLSLENHLFEFASLSIVLDNFSEGDYQAKPSRRLLSQLKYDRNYHEKQWKSYENMKNMAYIIINAYYTTYPCFRKHVDGVYTYSNTVTACNEL